LAVVVALAATILFAFGVSKLTDPPRVSSEMPLPANGISPTEKNEPLDLAIARSLVDPALQWDSNNDSILSELDTVNEPIEDWIADSPDSDESFESTIESDETLAWMVAAVKASDQSAEGTRADTQHDG
jgi:hypothetical protein